ncbi:MAG: ABC transporter ATP-binding protein [Anaerolineaceae bacterium]|nr:MAG: ABC transporter ATP-binding protein [Anaerolineaceae bacterium]
MVNNVVLSDKPTFDLKQTVTDNRLLGLWRMLTGYRWLFVAATISIGLAAVFHTGFFYLLRYYTDNILGDSDKVRQLPWIALGFILLALLQGTFTFLSGRWAAAAAEGATVRLRDYLYDHIQRLSFAYHDRTSTGELIQRATSDVDAMRRFYAEQAIGAGRIVTLFLVNFVALLSLNVQLALISVVVIPIVLIVSIFFFSKISERYERFQEQEAKLSTTLQENLTGIRVVRAFARREYEEDKFEADNQERFQRGKRLLMMHAVYWPSTDILVGAQMLIGFFVGAMMAINGTITLGTYLAYIGLLGWLLWPMRNLGRLIVQMSMGMVSFSRVREIIKEDREPLYVGTIQPDGGLRGDIRFEHVCFEYGSEATVLRDISFECAAGQSVALIGGTGSGKTSLVNLLPRFYEYTDGRITLDDVELREYPRHYLRRQIGIVQQEPFLFSRTIRENISYGVGREITAEEIESAARAASIHEVILTFPEGYNTIVGEKGVTLSGGQKQRITLARTLLKDPCILILDDATSSVDMETEAAIRDALEQLIPGRTTFIIAHRIQTVMNADLILVLDKGRVVQCGAHEELLEAEGPYQQIFNLQARIEDELAQDLAGVVL